MYLVEFNTEQNCLLSVKGRTNNLVYSMKNGELKEKFARISNELGDNYCIRFLMR